MSDPSTGQVNVEHTVPGRGALRARQLHALERTPLFQALPRKQRHRVSGITELRHYHDGDVIVRGGEPGDSFHVVLEGDVLVVPAVGPERILPSETHFGELSLIDGGPRAATVSAVGPVTTGCLMRSEFLRLLHDEPTLAAGLLPGLTLIVRDLTRRDHEQIPDLGQIGDWRGAAGEPRSEAEGLVLEGRDALGWLVLVRHIGTFEALAERHLRHIAKYISIQRYADSQTVVLAGTRGDAMYVILNGCAAVRTPGGHTRTLFPDDCFGELSLLDGAPRAATVSAVGELTAARIRRTDFQKILHSEPGMAIGLLNAMVKTVRDLQGAGAD